MGICIKDYREKNEDGMFPSYKRKKVTVGLYNGYGIQYDTYSVAMEYAPEFVAEPVVQTEAVLENIHRKLTEGICESISHATCLPLDMLYDRTVSMDRRRRSGSIADQIREAIEEARRAAGYDMTCCRTFHDNHDRMKYNPCEFAPAVCAQPGDKLTPPEKPGGSIL